LGAAGALMGQNAFVYVADGHLVRGAAETPYYYKGVNLVYAPLLWSDSLRLQTELDTLQALGVSNVRVPYDEAFDRLPADSLYLGYDRLLRELAQRKMTAVLGLADSRTARRLVERTNRLTGSAYADDPTIMAWQLQLEYTQNTAAQKDRVHKWAQEVKAKAPRQLLSLAGWGSPVSKVDGTFDDRLIEALHNVGGVDYIALQVSPLEWGWTSVGNLYDALPRVYIRSEALLAQCARIAGRMYKPLVVDAVGYPRERDFREPTTPTDSRDAVLNFFFSQLAESREGQGALAGCNVYTWGGQEQPAEAPTPQRHMLTGEGSRLPQGQYAVYATDASTLRLIRKAQPMK
ncbi:MAG: hypothetical protein Q4P78_09335, partial [Rothia sp. (in: high G+C Gram-positive bacteria)]|uniref:hypothetical protein n=1 Tax=Rothia sp. (in: high G+C Gram-positive bacteria) TaxID=1885016 RepID=UPI0026E02B58